MRAADAGNRWNPSVFFLRMLVSVGSSGEFLVGAVGMWFRAGDLGASSVLILRLGMGNLSEIPHFELLLL